MAKKAELISIREYARRRGCSDTSVHKAIREGKIVNGRVVDKDGKPKINPAIADVEWQSNHNPAYERKTKRGTQVFNADAGDLAPQQTGSDGQAVRNEQTLAAAKRAQAVYKAKLSELEFKKKAGQLVNKDEVYKALFAAGQELRQSIMAIPDRTIDNILAARSRNEAHNLLTNALADALEALVDIQTRDLSNER
jgi:hypothetical protein